MSAENKQPEQPDQIIDVLPQYFPLMHPKCEAPTDLFFACFEKEAQMKHASDTDSAKTSLAKCQPELKGYMKCMDENYVNVKKKDGAWWKMW